MSLFSQHSAAALPDADEVNGTQETGLSDGLLDTMIEVFERTADDEPQVTDGAVSDLADDAPVEPDDEPTVMDADSTAGGIASLVAQLFGARASNPTESDETPDRLIEIDLPFASTGTSDATESELPDTPKRWRRQRSSVATETESAPESIDEPTDESIADLTPIEDDWATADITDEPKRRWRQRSTTAETAPAGPEEAPIDESTVESFAEPEPQIDDDWATEDIDDNPPVPGADGASDTDRRRWWQRSTTAETSETTPAEPELAPIDESAIESFAEPEPQIDDDWATEDIADEPVVPGTDGPSDTDRRRWWQRSTTAETSETTPDAPEDEPAVETIAAPAAQIDDRRDTEDIAEDAAVPGTEKRRWWRRRRSGGTETIAEQAAPEPTERTGDVGGLGAIAALTQLVEDERDGDEYEVEPELSVGFLTDEDLGLGEPPRLSRKERRRLKKAEPRGRRARKKANEQADLDLGSRVMALASTVPDGVKTLDYPKLYQNDDLLQMGLVARRRELAALHPKDDLDTLTAASVLGSVLRMDEELYSLKPRYIFRKIVLVVLMAGGGWFIAQKVKKEKEAEREAEAIAHLDKQFGDGPRPPIPD